jgi:hypothetical protein
MTIETCLEFPALIRPNPGRGDLHTVRITQNGLEVATMQGFFGNQQSRPLISVTRRSILEVTYRPPSITRTGQCCVKYADQPSTTKTLAFTLMNPAATLDYPMTQTIAELIEDMRLGKENAIPENHQVVLAPVKPVTKLIVGALVLGGLWSVALATRQGAALFVLSFFLSVSIAAMVGDYVRLRTGWHPLIKLMAVLLAAVGALALFVAVWFILQANQLVE